MTIRYQFTAGDSNLNAFFDRDEVATTGDLNNWLSGYSLLVIPAIAITLFQKFGVDLFELVLHGDPGSPYEFRFWPTLEFTPGSPVENLLPGVPAAGTIGGTNNRVLTTDSNGFGTIRMTLT